MSSPTPTAVATAEPAPEPPRQASFLAVGDILLSRQVAAAIKKAGDPLLPFRPMAEVFRSVDFCFGNLESPFSGKDFFSVSSGNVFNTPLANIQGLVEYRFKIVNLANNHILDQGRPGLRFTLKYLAEHHIANVGAGNNLDEAWQPAVVQAGGIRIGFAGASYASVNDGGGMRNPHVARLDHHDRLKTAMGKLKSLADFIVITMHAGPEFAPRHGVEQKLFARRAIDLGADIVFGAHPHMLHAIDRYRGKYIFYSLGNFIFDTTKPLTTDSVAVKTFLQAPTEGGAELVRLELIPAVIEKRSTPRLANESETKRILEQLGVDQTVLLAME